MKLALRLSCVALGALLAGDAVAQRVAPRPSRMRGRTKIVPHDWRVMFPGPNRPVDFLWETSHRHLFDARPNMSVQPDGEPEGRYLPPPEQVQARAVDPLVQALHDTSDPALIEACLWALQRIGLQPEGQSLADMFRDHLKSTDSGVATAAVRGLVSFADADGLELLGRILATGEEGTGVPGEATAEVRIAVSEALAGSDPAELMAHLDRLELILTDRGQSSSARITAVRAIGRLDLDLRDLALEPMRRRAVDLLLAEVPERPRKRRESEAVVVPHAICALGDLLGPGASVDHQRVKKALVAMQRSRNTRPDEHAASVLALSRIALTRDQYRGDGFVMNALSGQMRRRKGEVAGLAAYGIGAVGGSGARIRLGASRFSNGELATWKAAGLLEDAIRLYRVDGSWKRMTVAKTRSMARRGSADAAGFAALACALCGDREVLTVIKPWAAKSRKQALYAAMAWTILDEEEHLGINFELAFLDWAHPMLAERAAAVLAHRGDAQVTPALLDGLKSMRGRRAPNAVVVFCRALGRYGDQRALTALADVVLDQKLHPTDRAWAAWALGAVSAPDVRVPDVVDQRAWWVSHR